MSEVVPEDDRDYYMRETQLLVATVLARAGLPSRARDLLSTVRARGDARAPFNQYYIEAYTALSVDDIESAIDLLERWLGGRMCDLGRSRDSNSFSAQANRRLLRDHWWWSELKDEPRFVRRMGQEN